MILLGLVPVFVMLSSYLTRPRSYLLTLIDAALLSLQSKTFDISRLEHLPINPPLTYFLEKPFLCYEMIAYKLLQSA